MGFYLKKRGTEENLDKCDMVIKIGALTTNKKVMNLNGIFMAFNRFISNSAKHVLSFYMLLRKEAHFEWTHSASKYLHLKTAQ